MSNDYRGNNHDRDSRWYYTDGKRYIPSDMAREERRSHDYDRRRREPYPPQRRSSDPRQNGRYPDRRPPARDLPDKNGLTRAGRIAKTVFITSLSMLLLILVAIGGVYLYVQQNILNKITFVEDEPLTYVENLDDVVIESDDDNSGEGEELTEEESAVLIQTVSEGLIAEEDLYRQEGVTNILLLGTDNRNQSLKGSRSDTIILLSINERTNQIVMNSILRDTCVSIPGRSKLDKMNAAYAYGGASLAVKTFETNFGVDIDRYIVINFYAFMDIVDALGGMRLSINEQERLVMNDYVEEINKQLGLAADSGKLYKTGDDLLLTGKQVLGYVRNRYTGNGDFARTERQRIVLEKLIEECRNSDVTTLLNVVEAAASYVTTNYTQGEIVSLATNAFEYLDYDIINSRIPVDGTWKYAKLSGMSIVSIDIIPNRQKILETVYGI